MKDKNWESSEPEYIVFFLLQLWNEDGKDEGVFPAIVFDRAMRLFLSHAWAISRGWTSIYICLKSGLVIHAQCWPRAAKPGSAEKADYHIVKISVSILTQKGQSPFPQEREPKILKAY